MSSPPIELNFLRCDSAGRAATSLVERFSLQAQLRRPGQASAGLAGLIVKPAAHANGG